MLTRDWKIGDVKVTRVVELVNVRLPNFVFLDLTPEAVSEQPRENCKWCGIELDVNERSGGFCSLEHARFALTHWSFETGDTYDRTWALAYRGARRLSQKARTCDECGKKFHPKPHETQAQRYCSIQCAGAAKKVEIPERSCQVCGTIFTPPSSNPEARYCSLSCVHAANRVYHPRSCQVCGTYFIPKKETNFFCSRVCSDADRKARQIERVCECCGETYVAKRADSRFCSAQCTKLVYRVASRRNMRLSPPVFDYVFKVAA